MHYEFLSQLFYLTIVGTNDPTIEGSANDDGTVEGSTEKKPKAFSKKTVRIVIIIIIKCTIYLKLVDFEKI